MKRIELLNLGRYKTSDIIKQMFELPVAERKVSYAQMAKIVDILKALDGAEGELLLEDDQHTTLVTTIKEFPFGATTVELYAVLQGIVDAPKYVVPKPTLVPSEAREEAV